MKIKIFGVLVLVLAVVAGVMQTTSKSQQPAAPDPEKQKLIEMLERKDEGVGLTLKERIRLAQAKGEKRIQIVQGTTSMYGEFGGYNYQSACQHTVLL